ncbi:hypothetical protein L6R49_15895 [Myxococcota bacterium]|nr:hypothetical protein [Myxococcota bacterium]
MSLALILSLIVACGDKDESADYVQVNAADDTLTVDVGAAELLEARAVELRSNTGAVVIGTGEVSPGGGPIGTIHTVSVRIDEEYAELVDRATVRISSGDRGEDEYILTQDFADEGLYVYELKSVGAVGEEREDTFTLRLWDLTTDPEDTSASDSGV